MICAYCRAGANLLPELAEALAAPGRPQIHRINGLKRRIGNWHAKCRNRCPCQHRGTRVENLPDSQPVALVSAGFPPPEPTATPGVMKTTHRPGRRNR